MTSVPSRRLVSTFIHTTQSLFVMWFTLCMRRRTRLAQLSQCTSQYISMQMQHLHSRSTCINVFCDVTIYHCLSVIFELILREKINQNFWFYFFINCATVIPVFEVEPQSITVLEGGTVELHCSATGYPEPDIHWRKNGINHSLCYFC